jgi:hypothetical protein
MDEDEKQRRFLAYRAGWIAGAGGQDSSNPWSLTEAMKQAWLRGHQQGKDTMVLTMAHEAERLGLDAHMSLLVDGTPKK